MENQRLYGRVEIMRFIGIRSAPTWTKYKRMGMPIQRTPAGRVMADTHELREWLRSFRDRPCYCQSREEGAFASLAPR